jgi:hypothetical protein
VTQANNNFMDSFMSKKQRKGKEKIGKERKVNARIRGTMFKISITDESHGQADHNNKSHYKLIVTKTYKICPRGGQPQGGWGLAARRAYHYDPIAAS